jgi:hypothetical protein
MPALDGWFCFFDAQWIRLGPRVLTTAGHLPGNSLSGRTAANSERSIRDFLGDVELRRRRSNRCQLVSKILIKRVKPVWQRDHRLPVVVQHRNTVIEVLHIGRFDERVIEIFILRIQRMVDVEPTASFNQGPP